MVSDCGCVNVADMSAVYNQWEEFLNRNKGSYNSGTTPAYSYDPAMSFNGSVFDFDNSTFANTYSGLGCLGSYMGGYAGGYGMPYGGMYSGQNYWDWTFNNMKNSNEYNYQSIQLGRKVESELNTPSESIQSALSVLQDTVQHDDQKNIMPAYNKLCAAVSHMWPNLDEKKVKTRANTIYKEYAKKALYQDIRDNGSGIFMRKFWNGFTFGTLFKGSADENVAQLINQDISEEKRIYGKLGKGAGVATATAAIGTTGLLALKNVKPIATLMSRGKWGWIIAGASLLIGGITAFASGNKKSESPVTAVKSE